MRNAFHLPCTSLRWYSKGGADHGRISTTRALIREYSTLKNWEHFWKKMNTLWWSTELTNCCIRFPSYMFCFSLNRKLKFGFSVNQHLWHLLHLALSMKQLRGLARGKQLAMHPMFSIQSKLVSNSIAKGTVMRIQRSVSGFCIDFVLFSKTSVTCGLVQLSKDHLFNACFRGDILFFASMAG